MDISEQVEVAGQAIHDAICADRSASWRDCPKDLLLAAVDVVLALRAAGELSREADHDAADGNRPHAHVPACPDCGGGVGFRHPVNGPMCECLPRRRIVPVVDGELVG